jgi:hypothetical protein
VFPVWYEHHLHIKSKAIPVTGRGGHSCVSYVVPTSYAHKKVKLPTYKVVEAYRIVRC